MEKVNFETSGPLGVLTLTNPPLNLLSGELLDDLGAAVKEVKRVPLRALLLRAEGKVFSAGADVSAFKGKTESAARDSFTTHQQMIADLEELPFPTLAAVQAGSSRAREIIYTAEPYDAATFERWNIVNRVVPDDAFESQTRVFAERLANGPTLAYAAGKRMVRGYLDGGIRAADKLVAEVGPPLFQSEDMRAAVSALVEHGARKFRDKVIFRGR